MQKRIIEVVGYDPQWAEAYRTESIAVQDVLKGLDVRLHHIGSTNLAFKDYLIAHPDIAGEYGALKAKLADMCNNDNDTYCDGKTGFVQEHEKKALAWQACQQGDPADRASLGH